MEGITAMVIGLSEEDLAWGAQLRLAHLRPAQTWSYVAPVLFVRPDDEVLTFPLGDLTLPHGFERLGALQLDKASQTLLAGRWRTAALVNINSYDDEYLANLQTCFKEEVGDMLACDAEMVEEDYQESLRADFARDYQRRRLRSTG